jgi:DNA polymerase-3 subunit delta
MIYILYGDDDFSLHRAVEGIKAKLGDGELLGLNTTVLSGGKLTPQELEAAGAAVPFMAAQRLVIVEGLLSRFEPHRGRGRAAGAGPGPEKAEPFSTCIQGLPPTTVLVLTDGRLGNNNPLLRELSPRATVKTFPPLRGEPLRRWVQDRVRTEGGTISPSAAKLLADMVGENLWAMASEIEKLVVYAWGRRIEEGDISQVVASAREISVFRLVDALLKHQARDAGKWLHRLLEEGATPPYLLTMITRQFRLLVLAQELLGQGLSPSQAQSRLNLGEYAWRQTLALARAYPFPQIKEAYHHLLEADLSIKTGRRSGELALDILVAELCQGGRG